MLDYARQRAADLLNIPHKAVLATSGPAGPLASELPCEANGSSLYFLAPSTSDHLFNIEHNPTVSVLAAGWELVGKARIVSPAAIDAELDILSDPAAEWCELVEVRPSRIHIRKEQGWGYVETIELEGD